MKSISRIMTGAAAVAMVTLSAAAPAEARHRYGHRGGDGIDAGDVIAGVAILGGIAAIASAIDNDGRNYGYDNRYRYRNDYRSAVNSCANEAERYGRGRVQVTDVERRGNNSYRVRGVIQGGYDQYDRGYDRRYDNDYGRWDSDRDDRDGFTCTARSNGRITNFRVNDRGGYGY